MFAFVYSFILLLAEATHGGTESGGFKEFWNTYFNYPGFEAWKFLNLAIFIGILVYLLRTPLSEAFKAKRELIRAELIRAEEARQAALARLTETEAKLARLETEATAIRQKAEQEAGAEKVRIAQQTEEEIKKMREQAQSEIARIAKQTRLELRRFSAEESIRRAEELIKAGMNAEADSKLVRRNIQSIGGLS